MTKPDLTLVEGGRARAANDVQNLFAELTSELSIECPEMAGFVVVAWDDEGFMNCTFHVGPRTPVPGMMLRDYVNQKIKETMPL